MENTHRSGHSKNRSRHHGGGKGSYRGNNRRGSGGRGRGRGGRGRFRGEKIAHHRYIAKAEAGYVAPSIYVEDKVYDDFNVSPILKQNIKAKGYVHPTKIQAAAIPLILEGKDILGLASTGSGKTAAFLVPMMDKLLNDRSQKCLIIVPTRELAAQIEEEFWSLSKGVRLYSTLVIGGTSIGQQIRKLKRNPEIVIGTPGRLKDLFERGVLNLHLFNNIILDEVDRMLDMGFVPDITFLISKLRNQKQTLFFSATMSPAAEKIANTLLHNPVKVQVEKEEAGKNVHQDIVKVGRGEGKINTLTDILKKNEVTKVLVFSRTKRGADRLSNDLKRTGLKVDSIHGDKSQNKRLRVLKSFKENAIDILVATDVAARGLDIPNVSHVINYDEPENYKDYIHRIGRTGRAGKAGTAYTFVSK